MEVMVYLNNSEMYVVNPNPEVWAAYDDAQRSEYCEQVLTSRGVFLPNVNTIDCIIEP